jgi:hypothetical protein
MIIPLSFSLTVVLWLIVTAQFLERKKKDRLGKMLILILLFLSVLVCRNVCIESKILLSVH